MNIDQVLLRFDSFKRIGGGKFQASCPMPDHDDSDPSVSVSQDVTTGAVLMFCWGCKRKANELVGSLGLTMSDLFGDPGHPMSSVTAGTAPSEVSEEDLSKLESYLAQARENLTIAEGYISQRFGLSVEDGQNLKLGADPGDATINRPDGYQAFNSGVPHLIIPFLDPGGKVVGMQGRRLVDGEPRWRSKGGSGWSKIGCFDWKLDGPVIVTEGPSDALTVVGRAKLPALAIRGASLTDEFVCQQIKEWLGGRPAVVIGDTGEAGERFSEEISHGVGLPVWPLPEGYSDVSDFLCDGGNLDEAVRVAEACPPEDPELTPAEQRELLKHRIVACWPDVIDDIALLSDLAEFRNRYHPHYEKIFNDLRARREGNLRGVSARDFDAVKRGIDAALPQSPTPGGGAGHGGGVHAPLLNPPDPHLPEIVWNAEDQLHVTEHTIRHAMDEYNGNHFYRSAQGQYVKVVEDEIVALKDSGVRSMLSQMGHWRVILGAQEKGHVPIEAAKVITDPSWECGLPAIKRRVEVPFMLGDGEIVSSVGFHEESGVYLLPRNGDVITVPEVSTIVTDEDVRQAKLIFEHVTDGFIFKEHASKTNLIAMTLTSPLRELFRHSPMVPILTSTAPQSGSGKGTSVRVPLSTVGVGPYSLSTTAYNSDENEFEKKLVGKLLKKSTYIFLDNIRGSVNSSVLEQMLTAANYDGRTLGYSEVNSLSTMVLWVSTLQSTGSFNRDLTRRCVPVELIKNYKGTWLHKNIDAYLSDMRGEMIWACFVVARKWLQDGGPTSEVRLDGYGGWTEVIGGMLEHVLGYDDFLGNLGSFRKAQEQTSMTIDGVLERWLMQYGEEEHPARMGVEDYEDPSLHQMLDLHNPSTRQVMNSIQRQLDTQAGHIIGDTHIWTPLGYKPYKHEGMIKLYRCERLPEDDE